MPFNKRMQNIERYREVVDDNLIDNIYEKAAPLIDKHVVHINSTLYGGGVAEILNSLVILMNQVGIDTGWRQIKGTPDFFVTTKNFHNALQGAKIELTDEQKQIFVENNQMNSIYTHISDHDCVIVHDPQPLSLVTCYRKRQPWIWRCHIDITNKYQTTWNYLYENFVNHFDSMVVSMRDYMPHDVDLPQSVIMPSIDPLNFKNKDMSEDEMDKLLLKRGIDHEKPIISQISRFDKWKDPLGVVKTFKKVKEKVDCKLVLLGGTAHDDPEGPAIYDKLMKKIKHEDDIIVCTSESSFFVNALQRRSDVVLQKSIREGFALTVSEALWKGTPVVGSNVGGIPLQVIDGKTGYLVDGIEDCANKTVKLLKNPDLAKKMGENGREHVRENFLITRHLMDYINLLKDKMIHYKVD